MEAKVQFFTCLYKMPPLIPATPAAADKVFKSSLRPPLPRNGSNTRRAWVPLEKGATKRVPVMNAESRSAARRRSASAASSTTASTASSSTASSRRTSAVNNNNNLVPEFKPLPFYGSSRKRKTRRVRR